jgi:glycosyltransferase involved in cell wall biosynthesis
LRIAVIGVRAIPNDYSGLERSCECLFPRLVERGHEVTVYCRPGALTPQRQSYRGVRLMLTPALTGRSLETLSHAATSLAHAMIRGGYDLIHFHALAPNLLAPISRLARIPTVATVHGLDWQRAKWKGLASAVLQLSEWVMVNNVNAVICVSRHLQDYYMHRYQCETAYIPNGISPARTGCRPADDVLREFGLNDRPYVAFVGRLVPEKRVHDLIAAFAEIETDHRLVIVGDGRHSEGYARLLRHTARTDRRVVFTGHQSGEALWALQSRAAVYVSPSELEGLPNAVLENMAYGVPMVLSDIAPHRELLNGLDDYDLFFRVGDAAGLADRLRLVMADSAKYRSIARAVQAVAERCFSWADIAVSTEQIYYQAIRSRAGPATARRSLLPTASREGDALRRLREGGAWRRAPAKRDVRSR